MPVEGIRIAGRRIAILGLALASLAGAIFMARPASAEETELMLSDGRFRVTAQWATPTGLTGPARAVPLTDDTGYFWFFTDSNIELTVKVLDACAAPFDRFWVFAAGLTNVEVELTVEDTFSGQVETYVNPLSRPYPPLQDTASFATCDVSRECGMGTFAEIQATPRSDERAERAALAIGGSLTAREADYQRTLADLASISADHPELADVEYLTTFVPNDLIVGLERPVYDQVVAGTYDGWDCLNDWYRAAIDPIAGFEEIGYVLLTFDGIFDLNRLADEYEPLPGVINTELNGVIQPPLLPPSPALCANADGNTHRYFFEAGPTWYFSSTPGAVPTLVGTYDGTGSLPTWWSDYMSCFVP